MVGIGAYMVKIFIIYCEQIYVKTIDLVSRSMVKTSEGESSDVISVINLHLLTLTTLKYFSINYGDQRIFFNLKSSQLSYLALSDPFEFLHSKHKTFV